MSHQDQVIRALRQACDEYKRAAKLHKDTIELQLDALSKLKNVIVQLIPRTDFEDNEKETMYHNLGLTKTENENEH